MVKFPGSNRDHAPGSRHPHHLWAHLARCILVHTIYILEKCKQKTVFFSFFFAKLSPPIQFSILLTSFANLSASLLTRYENPMKGNWQNPHTCPFILFLKNNKWGLIVFLTITNIKIKDINSDYKKRPYSIE
jgi:hypothetical protein